MASIKEYTKKDGKTYYKFRLYVGVNPLTGEDQYVSRSNFKNKKEVKKAIDEIKLEIKRENYKKRQIKTYQEVYDLWVIEYKNTVEQSTFIKTMGIFKNHILPKMGKYRIDKIDVTTCQKHVNEWSDDLKNFKSVKSYAAKVLHFAIKHDYIKTNPFSLIEMPIKRKKVTLDDEEFENFYTKEELLTFLDCMKQESNVKPYVFFHLLSYSGMRKGEALALTWKDINFKNNEIRINKAISRGEEGLYLKSTKTRTTRIISMDSDTMELLKKWKKQQQEELLALGFNSLLPKQLVFSNEKNEFLQPTKTRKWLVHVLEKYKLPMITTHGFRHTHTTLLHEAGVNLKTISERLSHADAGTTLNTYTHVSQKAKDEAIDKFTDYLSL